MSDAKKDDGSKKLVLALPDDLLVLDFDRAALQCVRVWKDSMNQDYVRARAVAKTRGAMDPVLVLPRSVAAGVFACCCCVRVCALTVYVRVRVVCVSECLRRCVRVFGARANSVLTCVCVVHSRLSKSVLFLEATHGCGGRYG